MLDVLRLAEYGLCDHLTLIKRRPVLTSERAEVESRMECMSRLEQRVCAVGKNLEAVCAAHALVDELMAERTSLTAWGSLEQV